LEDLSRNPQKIAIGAAQFGMPYGIANKLENFNLENIKQIIDCAKKNHIDMIDTAILYGDSEINLGYANVENFKIITKLPPLAQNQDNIFEWMTHQIDTSLNKLRVNKLYGVLVHKADDLLGSQGLSLYKALIKIKKKKSLKIGVSIYDFHILKKILDEYKLDIVQVPFNLFDRRLEKEGWLRKLKDNEIEIHVRSIFLQGLLLMNRTDIPIYFRPWNKLFVDYHKWLESNKISQLEACFNFINQYNEIDRIVVGIDSAIQLEEIIIASKKNIPLKYPNFYSNNLKLINPSNWIT